LSQAILMINRYIHDPSRGHWEALKWTVWYIKGSIEIDFVFKKNFTVKHECIRYVNSDYAETLTNTSLQQDMRLHCPKYRSASVLLYSLLSHCLL